MTNPDYTALLLVIDRSGSMTAIRDDMVGGVNSLIAQQAAQPGRLTVDVVTFDDRIETQCSLADAASVSISLDPRGSTALYDAVGVAVTSFGRVLGAMAEPERPGTVQVVVITDGEENASREHTAQSVRALVSNQTEVYGWDFVFLGANQDAVLTGAELGFDEQSSMTFAADADHIEMASTSVSRYITGVRSKSKLGFTDTDRIGSNS